MQIIDACGVSLNPIFFIKVYKEAKKLAPPRFLTLRLCQARYDELYTMAEVPESIQLGPTPGPLGTIVHRVLCVKPPMGVSDGIAIAIDPKMDPSKLQIEIHGQIELIVENLSHDASS